MTSSRTNGRKLTTDGETFLCLSDTNFPEIGDKIGYNYCFPSIHDPSQAPSGKHTGLISMMAPYRLREGAEKWYNYKFKEETAEKCLTTVEEYCLGIKDKVLWSRCWILRVFKQSLAGNRNTVWMKR